VFWDCFCVTRQPSNRIVYEAIGGRPQSQNISESQMRVPPVPRTRGPGMPRTSTRNPFVMIQVNPFRSASVFKEG
jgi:hypothetical protein